MPTNNKIKTEVEIIKSREFLKLLSAKLKWDISFFLVGKLKKTEIKEEDFYKFAVTTITILCMPLAVQAIIPKP